MEYIFCEIMQKSMWLWRWCDTIWSFYSYTAVSILTSSLSLLQYVHLFFFFVDSLGKLLVSIPSTSMHPWQNEGKLKARKRKRMMRPALVALYKQRAFEFTYDNKSDKFSTYNSDSCIYQNPKKRSSILSFHTM